MIKTVLVLGIADIDSRKVLKCDKIYTVFQSMLSQILYHNLRAR